MDGPTVDVSEPTEEHEDYTEEHEDYAEEDYEEDDETWEAEAAALAGKFESLVSFHPMGAGGSGGGGSSSSSLSTGGAQLSQSAGSSLSKLERKGSQAKHTGLTRDERATVDQVLDPRTRLLLFKLINTGTLESINGCVSTGKEANVYHAFGSAGSEFAVKVYKTSILVFRDRDRYVSGEFRFRHGYCKANPRKMVRMWAEKEMRNYRRLALAEVPCPAVHLLREHVLLMEFIGRDGHAAPRLKDATLSDRQHVDACKQTMLLLRQLYHSCRLVHADFSEYNLLWYQRTVYVIDVSQAVEHDHPNALTFLRKDCENTIHFYRRAGVPSVPSLQRLFTFVTSPLLGKRLEAWSEAYDRMVDEQQAAEAHGDDDDDDDDTNGDAGGGTAAGQGDGAGGGGGSGCHAAEVSEAVFAQMHIPRTLEEVPMKQIERDVDAFRRGEAGAEGLAYMSLMGLNPDLTVARDDDGPAAAGRGAASAGAGSGAKGQGPETGQEGATGARGDEEEGESEEESEGEDGSEGEEGGDRFAGRVRRHKMLHKEEDKDDKRERKAVVKAAQREARTHKTPKHLKKAAKKAGAGKKR